MSVNSSANVVDDVVLMRMVVFLRASPFEWYGCLLAFDSLACFGNVFTLIVGNAAAELAFFVLYVRSLSEMLWLPLYIS